MIRTNTLATCFIGMKNYVIIGASNGIGAGLRSILEDEGHHVVGTSNKNPQAGLMHLDILDKEPDFSFLPDSIDGLIYCPGSINLKPFKRIKPNEFVDDYRLQVEGAIKSIQASLPALVSAKGSIVLFSTVAVQQGFNFHSQVSSSKGAIEGLTRALAAELSPTLRINCIAPSLTDTPLAGKLLSTPEKKAANGERHPLKRVGEVEDIASAANFLLSDKASWITGQILHVDGGMSIVKA